MAVQQRTGTIREAAPARGGLRGRGCVRGTPSSCCLRLRGAPGRAALQVLPRDAPGGRIRIPADAGIPSPRWASQAPLQFINSHSHSLSSFRFACLSTICLFKFLLNKMGISLCLFVRIFCIHLLFTSFIFLRCLQQILAGCSVCVINKTAVKILTVRPNCQP